LTLPEPPPPAPLSQKASQRERTIHQYEKDLRIWRKRVRRSAWYWNTIILTTAKTAHDMVALRSMTFEELAWVYIWNLYHTD